MKELSLHILDIVQNSIRAKATTVEIQIQEDLKENKLEIRIQDNGQGMEQEFIDKVKNPFATTRTTRKIGLGIPLLLEACKRCNGNLEIKSEKEVGTIIKVYFDYDHIDRAPMGDIVNTITMLLLSSPEIRYIFTYIVNHRTFTMDTDEVKKILEGVPINDLTVIHWMKEYLEENLRDLKR